MSQFRRGSRFVDAIRFDGTASTISALAALGCRRETEDDDGRLVVPTPCGPVYIEPGLFVLNDRGTLSVVDEGTLSSFYELIPPRCPGALPC